MGLRAKALRYLLHTRVLVRDASQCAGKGVSHITSEVDPDAVFFVGGRYSTDIYIDMAGSSRVRKWILRVMVDHIMESELPETIKIASAYTCVQNISTLDPKTIDPETRDWCIWALERESTKLSNLRNPEATADKQICDWVIDWLKMRIKD